MFRNFEEVVGNVLAGEKSRMSATKITSLNTFRAMLEVMITQTEKSSSSARLGFWSATFMVVAFIVFTGAFVAIALNPPLYTWNGLPGYLTYVTSVPQSFQHIARFTMLAFGPLYVVVLNSIYDHTKEEEPERETSARLALLFGLGFAILIGINYFTQLSSVRLSVAHGETAGLEQVIQANPYSAVAGINMLGWTLFFGLSSLFVAPVFTGTRLERIIRYAFLANGLMVLLGGIGYLFDLTPLVFITMNLGMGATVLVASTGLALWFRQLNRGNR